MYPESPSQLHFRLQEAKHCGLRYQATENEGLRVGGEDSRVVICLFGS